MGCAGVILRGGRGVGLVGPGSHIRGRGRGRGEDMMSSARKTVDGSIINLSTTLSLFLLVCLSVCLTDYLTNLTLCQSV